MNDPWRDLIDEVHAEVDAHRIERGLSPYEWTKHEPVRAAYTDRIVEKINTEEVPMAFGDRQPVSPMPLGGKPDGCDNIPGFGFLRIGQCRTEDCDNNRHGMDKASGYCRPCKIRHGMLKPDTLKPTEKLPVPKPWTPPAPPTVRELVVEKTKPSPTPSVPPELVDEVFSMLNRHEASRLMRALTDNWAGIPIATKVTIVRAALAETKPEVITQEQSGVWRNL